MPLEIKRHDNANFAVTGGTVGCHYDATSDDKVGIMTTLGF